MFRITLRVIMFERGGYRIYAVRQRVDVDGGVALERYFAVEI